MKEKISIFDDEILTEQPRIWNHYNNKLENNTLNSFQQSSSKTIVDPIIVWYESQNNFWRNLFLILLFLVIIELLILFFFFFSWIRINPNALKNTNNTNNTIEKNNIIENTGSICDSEKYQKLENKLNSIEKLIKLEDNLKKFINNMDKNNLTQKFEKFKEKNLDLVKQINSNNDLNENFENLFWREETYISTDKWLWIEVNDRDMSIIIPKDSNFPISWNRIYYTRNPYQKSMSFKVYQWNDDIALSNTYLWEFRILNLKKIKEVWERIIVYFNIDENWKLTFEAKDLMDSNNIINWFLDSEVDILKKTNNNIENIKKSFVEMQNKTDNLIHEVLGN